MLPPLLMAAIRFALVLFPRHLLSQEARRGLEQSSLFYGLCLGTGQFGLLYIAMDGFISPGMASVVMQMQVFFTILIAARLQEKTPSSINCWDWRPPPPAWPSS